jgi:hypothetical protein
MLDDDDITPEYGELGYRIIELRSGHEMRALLAILSLFGILLLVSLLVLTIVPSLR